MQADELLFVAELRSTKRPRKRCPADVVEEVRAGRLAALPLRSSSVDESGGVGPRMALRGLQLGNKSAVERQAWLEEARIEAVLGSCPRSLRLALRCCAHAWVEIHLFVCRGQ